MKRQPLIQLVSILVLLHVELFRHQFAPDVASPNSNGGHNSFSKHNISLWFLPAGRCSKDNHTPHEVRPEYK